MGSLPGVPWQIANGTLTFTTDGELDIETTLSSSANFVGATAGQVIAWDFGDSITTDGGTGLAGSTAFASPFSVNALDQDGYAAASIAGFGIGDDGMVVAAYSNGEIRNVAQLAIANFRSEGGLTRIGSDLYMESLLSGAALVGTAGTGGRGTLTAGALESSNVDLAQEFVNLIAYQRGFQSNARTVQTGDEMLAELVNLKR